MRLLFSAVLFTCMLCAPAFGEDKAPPSPSSKLCHENRDKCEEMQDRRAEFCKNNPATCEKRRHMRAERKELCKDDPQKCEKVKEERQERRERFCKQHPDQCPNRHDDEEQFHPHTTGPGDHPPGPPR